MSRAADALRLSAGTLTVLPVRPPRVVDTPTSGLAMLLAPVAVLPLAAAASGVVWLGDLLHAPPLLTAAVVLAVLAVGSGGLHLDGLADTADGLAVPGDRERRLAVMRAGDVGPVGAAALGLVLLLQASAVAGVVADHRAGAAVTVGLAVVVSRACLVGGCVRGLPAARAGGLGSAVAGSVPPAALVAMSAVVAAVALALDGTSGPVGVLVAAGLVAGLLVHARRRLGGITGDVLGACVELALVGYLLAQAVSLSGR